MPCTAISRQGLSAGGGGAPLLQALALQRHNEALEVRVGQLEGELLEARQQLAAAEDRLAKAGRWVLGLHFLGFVLGRCMWAWEAYS